MKTLFHGIAAYIVGEELVFDTTKPKAVELDSNAKLRVVPLDSSPAFWLDTTESIFYSDGQIIKVPPSPFRYACEHKVLAALASVGTVFTVVFDGITSLESADGTLASVLPSDLSDIRMRASVVNGLTIFALSARRKDEQYLFVAVKKNVWETRINCTASRIEQRGTTTLTLSELSPSGLIGTVEIFDASFTKEKSYPVYTGTPSTTDPVLLAYDYLKLELDTEARALFTANLFADTPFDLVKSFYREYIKIKPAPFCETGIYEFYIDLSHATLFRATLVEGLIDNLEECDHPLFGVSS